MPIKSDKRILLMSLAEKLAAAWDYNTTVEAPSIDEIAENRAEAYFVQDKILGFLGETVEGWKVGAASVKMQGKEGHDAIVTGRLFGSKIYFGNTQEIDSRNHPNSRIEAEFGLRLTQDVLPVGPVRSREDLARISVPFIAIEIIGNRYPKDGIYKPDTLATISDNGGASGAVIGQDIDNSNHYDFLTHPITLRINEGPEVGNLAPDLRAEPLDALAQLCEQMRERKIALNAGQIILTGGATIPASIAPGDQVTANFGPMGEIKFTLSA